MRKFLLIFVLLFSLITYTCSCSPEDITEKKTGKIHKGTTEIEKKVEKPTYKYEILRRWKPYPKFTDNGLGLEILLKEKESDLTEKGIVKFINTMKKHWDPVVIKIYLSRKAYQEGLTESFTVEYDKGYLLFYVKNTTVRGAYYGLNEIRWMQEKGKFSNLFGHKTKLKKK